MYKKKIISTMATILLLGAPHAINCHIIIKNDSLNAVKIELKCEKFRIAHTTVASKRESRLRVGHSRCSGLSSLSKLEFTATSRKPNAKKHVLLKNMTILDGDTIKITQTNKVIVVPRHLRQ